MRVIMEPCSARATGGLSEQAKSWHYQSTTAVHEHHTNVLLLCSKQNMGTCKSASPGACKTANLLSTGNEKLSVTYFGKVVPCI